MRRIDIRKLMRHITNKTGAEEYVFGRMLVTMSSIISSLGVDAHHGSEIPCVGRRGKCWVWKNRLRGRILLVDVQTGVGAFARGFQC